MRKGTRIVFVFYLLALIATGAVLLVILWRQLGRYQADLDAEQAEQSTLKLEERAPQIAFEQYMAERENDPAWWSEQLIRQREADGEEMLETAKQVRTYFEDLLAANTTQLFKADTWTEQAPVYKVRIGEGTGASATVALTGSGLSWTVSDVRISVRGTCSGETEAPAGATVLCGRSPLGEEYMLPDGVSYFPFPEYEQVLENPVTWHHWQVSGLLCEPEMTVQNTADAGWSEADQCTVLYGTEEDAERFDGKAEEFVRAYLRMATGGKDDTDAHMAACLALVRNDSTAHELLVGSRGSFSVTMAWSNLEVDILSRNPLIRWADNAYSVDITYHAYASIGGARKDYSEEDQTIRVLFLNQGKGWEICAFQMIN